MKLLPQPFDFLLNYPLWYYLRSMFKRESNGAICYSITPTATGVLVALGGEKGAGLYSSNLKGKAGIPTLDLFDPDTSDEDAFAVRGEFHKRITKKHNLHQGARCAIIIDHPQMYLNFHGMQGDGVTVEQVCRELSEAPHSILPGWQGDGDRYEWAVVTDKFSVAKPKTVASDLRQVFLAGIPKGVVDFICKWSKKNQQILTGIIPYPLAVAGWFRSLQKSEGLTHLVIPNNQAVALFSFKNQQCTQFFSPKNDNFVAGEIAGAIEDVNANENLMNHECPAFVWPAEGFDSGKLVQSLRQSGVRSAQMITESLLPPEQRAAGVGVSLCEWALKETYLDFKGVRGSIGAIGLGEAQVDEP